MSDPALALQGALVQAIKNADVGVGENVFDRVSAADPYPRVTIGAAQSVGNYADCYDGTEHFVQLDVWSRGVGYPEVKQIASAIRDLVNSDTLTLQGHTLEIIEITDTNYSRDPDGLTSRARINVRALSQPAD